MVVQQERAKANAAQSARPRRPPAKGRLGKPVEFGHKAQVCDNADGIVLDHHVKRTGRTPRTVAADRGYGEASVDDALTDLGIHSVVIPAKGRPTKARQAPRTGVEASGRT
jgi:IS5 family transposase